MAPDCHATAALTVSTAVSGASCSLLSVTVNVAV
jgi:hypothetical protein